MKWYSKKVVAWILALVMVMGLVTPLPAKAEVTDDTTDLSMTLGTIPPEENAVEEIDSGECGLDGSNLIWVYDSAGTLTISGKGEMYDYFNDNAGIFPWDAYRADIQSIVVNENVTTIAREAFRNCFSLSSVVLPNTLGTIAAGVFATCPSLTEIVIPDSVTSIENVAFYGCSGLTSITFSKNLNYIHPWAFGECTGLQEIVIPYGVTGIGEYAFEGCIALERVELPDSVVSLDIHAFQGCSSLREVTLSEGLTDIADRTFDGCSSLTEITIPAKVKRIGIEAFGGCSSLNKVIISEGILRIGDLAFYECGNLTEITIPNSVVSIGVNAFEHCVGLSQIVIPNSVTSIGVDAFAGCEDTLTICCTEGSYAQEYALQNGFEIEIMEGSSGDNPPSDGNDNEIASGVCGTNGDNLIWVLDKEGTLTISGEGAMYGYSWNNAAVFPWEAYRDEIRCIVIEENVTTIDGEAFRNCINLQFVELPNTLQTIRYSAFRGCIGLVEIVIPDSVTMIESAVFADCSALESVILSGNLDCINEYAFQYCTSLREMVIPYGVTKISNSAFKGCSSLERVELPDSVEILECYAFENCSSLSEITIPESVYFLDSYLFNGCSSLTEITIPSAVEKIGDGALQGCSSLGRVVISEGVKNLGGWTFNGCSSLNEVVIPHSVISIGNGAFYGCSSLPGIELPDSVENIGQRVFECCDGWFTIYCNYGSCAEEYAWENGLRVGILDGPIASITIEDTSIVEDTNWWTEGYYDEELDQDVEYRRYYFPVYGTAILEDGTEIPIDDNWIVLNDREYEVSLFDDQDYGNEWELGTHTVTANLFGAETTFNVEVIENPFESIFIEDAVIIENVDWWWDSWYDEETGETHEYRRYGYPVNGTAILKDGREVEILDWCAEVDGVEYYVDFDDRQHIEEWGVGTRTFTATLAGVETTFTIEVIENPIERIEIEDTSVVEGTNREWVSYYDEELGEQVEFWCYNYEINGVAILKDGTEVPIEEYFTGDKNTGLWISDEQSPDNEWGVGTYTLTAVLLGVETTFTVEIIESPIESISIEDVTITEGVDCWFADWLYDNDADGPVEYWRYDYDIHGIVTLKDGREIPISETYDTWIWITIDGNEYPIIISDGQAYENEWGVGSHTVTAEMLGVETTFTVEIVEGPIERIEVNDVTIVADANWWMDSYYDDKTGESYEYRRYNYDLSGTVFLKDGTTLSIDEYWESSPEEDLVLYDDQHLGEWGIGSHTVMAEWFGVITTFNVEVIENPIERIEIEDTSVVEGTNREWVSYYDEELGEQVEFWCYNYEINGVAILKDGTEVPIEEYFTGDKNTGLWISDEQSPDNEWGVGTYTLTAVLLGVETTFTVEILPASDILYGDANGDGIVNNMDRVFLTRYLADWEGYTEENINLEAMDVNRDGVVNDMDRVILTRHLADWEGYEFIPYE